AHHLGLELPKNQAMELDGASFIGSIDAADLKAEVSEGNFKLTWKSYSSGQTGRVWISATNEFKIGGLDNYWLMGEVKLDAGAATFSTKGMESDFYKVVMETPAGYLNYWIVKK